MTDNNRSPFLAEIQQALAAGSNVELSDADLEAVAGGIGKRRGGGNAAPAASSCPNGSCGGAAPAGRGGRRRGR